MSLRAACVALLLVAGSASAQGEPVAAPASFAGLRKQMETVSARAVATDVRQCRTLELGSMCHDGFVTYGGGEAEDREMRRLIGLYNAHQEATLQARAGPPCVAVEPEIPVLDLEGNRCVIIRPE